MEAFPCSEDCREPASNQHDAPPCMRLESHCQGKGQTCAFVIYLVFNYDVTEKKSHYGPRLNLLHIRISTLPSCRCIITLGSLLRPRSRSLRSPELQSLLSLTRNTRRFRSTKSYQRNIRTWERYTAEHRAKRLRFLSIGGASQSSNRETEFAFV